MDYNSELRNNRIKNSTKTVATDMCRVLLVTICPFIIRTLIIYHLGNACVGINTVLSSIISILNLAEFGLGNVIVFFLYEPLARGDKEKVCRYLNALRKIYKGIGVAVFTIGVSLLPFMKYIMGVEVPSGINIYLIYMMALISNVIAYFAVPEVLVLANAMQCGYIASALSIIGNIVVYVLQYISITYYESLTLYYAAIMVQCAFMAFLRVVVKNKFFAEYKPHGVINDFENKALKKRVLALIGHQMDEYFVSNIDNIIISAVLGLSLVAIYGNYMYVISAVSMMISTVINSLTPSIGNSFVTESKESNYIRFRAVMWINSMSVIWAASCMLCMYQSFMLLWMGDRLLPMRTVGLFCAYFFVSQIRKPVLMFKNANGMWIEDLKKPYICMIINLIADILLVNIIGIDGVLISSILCIAFIEMPWEGKVLYRGYFKRSTLDYFKSISRYLIYGILFSVIVYILCEKTFSASEGVINIAIRGGVVTLLFLLLTLATYRKSEELRIWIETMGLLLKKHEN